MPELVCSSPAQVVPDFLTARQRCVTNNDTIHGRVFLVFRRERRIAEELLNFSGKGIFEIGNVDPYIKYVRSPYVGGGLRSSFVSRTKYKLVPLVVVVASYIGELECKPSVCCEARVIAGEVVVELLDLTDDLGTRHIA